jgi:mediator of RNA polymerase II transcription subunit 31
MTTVGSPLPTSGTNTNNNNTITTTTTPPPPTSPSPRFTLELEFVLSLSNPYYLSHLALTYPHLLNPPPKDSRPPSSHPSQNPSSFSTTTSQPELDSESDASRFASYLAYLYNYWRKPEYARCLTHPGATLRNLELLQQEQFRRDVIRPDVIEKLLTVETEEAAAGDEEGGEVKESMEIKGGDDATAATTGEQEVQVKEEGGEVKVTEGQEEGAMDVAVG